MLTTTGRKTGKAHSVWAKAVTYNDMIYFSRRNPNSDWLKNAIVNPDKKYPYKLKLPYNIHDVINKGKPLTNGGYELTVDSDAEKNYKGDYIKWCRDLFWWGRKEGRYKSTMENKGDLQKKTMG